MKKGYLLLVMLLSLLFTMPMLTATAAQSGLLTYEIKGNGTATITGFDWAHNDGDIYLPLMIDGYSITGIGDEAFAGTQDTCKKYNEKSTGIIMHLPDTITTIGEKAFYGAPISSINIPNSLQSIGKGAFGYCYLLRNFSISNSHTKYAVIDGILYNKQQKELICCPRQLLTKKDSKITIPEGIKKIGDYAFSLDMRNGLNGEYYPYNINVGANITLPSTISEIGDYAFIGNHFAGGQLSFKKITTLSKIGQYAFAYSSSAHNIDMPNITEIGEYAFYKHSDWSGYSFRFKKIDRILPYAFAEGYFNTIDRSTECQPRIIGAHAFQHCKIVTQALTTASAQSIGEYAFYGHAREYPNTRYSYTINCDIGPYAFSHTSLGTVTIKSGCKSIGDYAFNNSSISKLNLSEGILTIGEAAFSDMYSSQPDITVELPSSLTYIAPGAFDKIKFTLKAKENTYAGFYTIENGYAYNYSDSVQDLSWLNN